MNFLSDVYEKTGEKDPFFLEDDELEMILQELKPHVVSK